MYFCCMEALQNAAKHAPEAGVAVRLTDDGRELRLLGRRRGPGHRYGRRASTATGSATCSTGWWPSAARSHVGRSPSGGTRVDGRIRIPLASGGPVERRQRPRRSARRRHEARG